MMCQPATAGKQDALPALLEDVSASGIRLRLRRWFEPGRMLVLRSDDPHGGLGRSLLAHVVYARMKGGGQWTVGCALLGRLEAAEVESIG